MWSSANNYRWHRRHQKRRASCQKGKIRTKVGGKNQALLCHKIFNKELFGNILQVYWFKYEMSSVEYLKLPALQYAHCQCIFRPQAVLCSTIWFMGFQSETCNKFFPSLKVQTQQWCRITPFFKCEMVGRFTEQNSQESQLSRGGDSPKKGKRIWEFFSPVFLEHLVFQKKVLLAAVKLWLDIWISDSFPGIKPIQGSKSLCVQRIALKWTISLFCK